MAKFFVCGDIVNGFSHKQFIGKKLLDIIRSSDFAIGNFEGCLGVKKKENLLIQTDETLHLLQEAGFNLMLLANNHISDYGRIGMQETIDSIDSEGLLHIGAGFDYDEVYKPIIVETGKIKVGVLNYCSATPYYFRSLSQKFGYAWMGDRNIGTRIKKLKTEVDKILVFVHAGLEHYTCPLKYLRDLYRWFCDIGADAVIASHPHVAQGLEDYKGKLICYSLGNFYFPLSEESDSSILDNNSYSLMLDISKASIEYNVIYHKMDNLIVDIIQENESKVNIKELSDILLPEIYEKIHSQTIKSAYETEVKNLYQWSLHTRDFNDSYRVKIKNVLTYLFLRKRFNNDAHNRHKSFVRLINSETLRFVASEYFAKDYEEDR